MDIRGPRVERTHYTNFGDSNNITFMLIDNMDHEVCAGELPFEKMNVTAMLIAKRESKKEVCFHTNQALHKRKLMYHEGNRVFVCYKDLCCGWMGMTPGDFSSLMLDVEGLMLQDETRMVAHSARNRVLSRPGCDPERLLG